MAVQDVGAQSSAVSSMACHWPMIDALLGGTSAMRHQGKTFLPQWPNEDDASYKARLSVAVLHPVFSRTARIMAAKPLSRPIVTSDSVPQKISDLFKDVDRQGTTLHSFAGQVMLACMTHGIHGVLVDYPKTNGIKTKAEEMASGARPYFTQYKAASILGWRVEPSDDGARLIQIRLMERVVEQNGDFGETEVDQVRVLTPGAWQTWRKDQKQNWVLFDEGTTTLDQIPFVFFYGLRESFGVGAPPLLDLAYQNVEHWQSASDQQTILHVARVPILFAKGFGDTVLTVGAGVAASTENKDADLTYVEHSGQSIAAGRQSLLDLEERMRQTGAELLTPRPVATTATAVVADGEANKSTLQQITEVFEESLNAAIDLMGDWIGEEAEDAVTIYKDFGAATLADQSTQDLAAATSAGSISRETLFEELQRRDVISADLSWEDEQGRLKADETWRQGMKQGQAGGG